MIRSSVETSPKRLREQIGGRALDAIGSHRRTTRYSRRRGDSFFPRQAVHLAPAAAELRAFGHRGCAVADGKDYSLGGADREEWDRLWGGKTLRLLPGECGLHLSSPFEFLKVKAAALSDDPPEFATRVWRESELCPVCGESTAGCRRVAAHLTVEYERPVVWPFMCEPSFWWGVWAHESCFDRCQETGRPADIPW